MSLLAHLRALLSRAAFGVSADEIRYTFEDVRGELRATRAELLEEIRALRREVEALSHTIDAGLPSTSGQGAVAEGSPGRPLT